MYHKDGIVVRLAAQGSEIEKFTCPSGQDPANTEWNDNHAIISAKLSTQFTVVLDLTEDFLPFAAKSLKLGVAIGHIQQIAGVLHDVQAWHIPLNQFAKNRFRTSQQMCWGGKSCEPLINEMRIPAPKVLAYKFDAVPNSNWAETCNAARGCIAVCLCHARGLDILLEAEAEVIETTDPELMLDVRQDETGAVGDIDDATHDTFSINGDDVESNGDEIDEDTSGECDLDESNSDDLMDPIHYTPAARSKRAAQRALSCSEISDPRCHDRLPVKRKRVVCSESKSPSTKRPPTEQPGSAVTATTHASNNTPTRVYGIAASTSMQPENVPPGAQMLPVPHNTPQPTPVETTPLTPANEAGTLGALREIHLERAPAERQLELSKATNRAAELEARNRINDLKQQI